jgi:Arc/MetJ family transcription regulator
LEVQIMRTTLDLDRGAVEEAMKVSPGLTKTAVIEEALREYSRRRRLAGFRDLRGRFRWEGDLDELRGRGRGTE